ncbi:MAG: hypothetical protein M0T70_18275 [Geobacteraceae bacterium]|nr:hypothetical protein [Geobacteraceae bacterium]
MKPDGTDDIIAGHFADRCRRLTRAVRLVGRPAMSPAGAQLPEVRTTC